jgi:two-component system, LytTR family, sensor kinase
MHPLVFLSAWQLLAVPFAVQDYLDERLEGIKFPFWLAMKEQWVHFLLWGVLCLGMWYLLRRHIEEASARRMLLVFLPLSMLVSVIHEALYLLLVPSTMPDKHYTYWQRLEMHLAYGFFSNVVVFWIVFALFRGIGQYRKYRERERVASQLEAQLTNSRLQALRMQLNPHFLFNALNSVSSLMRTDVEVADEMLERLSSLLRITLDQGDAQKIRLQEEIEIVQLYVSIQQLRYGDRVKNVFQIAPEAWDFLVPTMILQPVVENAYVHGVARSIGAATVEIEAAVHSGRLHLSVRNTCANLTPPRRGARKERLGIANVKARLQLHYGDQQTFSFEQAAPGDATAFFVLPIEAAYLKEEPRSAVYANSNLDRG